MPNGPLIPRRVCTGSLSSRDEFVSDNLFLSLSLWFQIHVSCLFAEVSVRFAGDTGIVVRVTRCLLPFTAVPPAARPDGRPARPRDSGVNLRLLAVMTSTHPCTRPSSGKRLKNERGTPVYDLNDMMNLSVVSRVPWNDDITQSFNILAMKI